MNKKIVLALCFLIFGRAKGLAFEDTLPRKQPKHFPLIIYAAPILDGASAAIEYKFNNRFAVNVYAFKRKSNNSLYYLTKVDENLAEISFKIYASNSTNKKFRPFISPCLGFRNIVYNRNFDFRFRRVDVFPQPGFNIGGDMNLKANAKYAVPFYFGFDYKSNRGLIFEMAAGISLQKSYGETFIHGPIITPYSDEYNVRSRFVFGYEF
jgi:hypothetical protein